MPGRLCCPGQPLLSSNSISHRAIAIAKSRPLSLVVSGSIARAVTNLQTVPRTKFTIALCSKASFSRKITVFGGNTYANFHTTTSHCTAGSTPAVSWSYRLLQTQLIQPSRVVNVACPTSKSIEALQPLFKKRTLVQSGWALSSSRIVARPLSTKGPNKLNGEGGSEATLADLDDDDADTATVLQKSLAAVPHHAIKNEIKLRVTELDAMGRIKITAGEYLKSDLCQQYGLHARDLRKIEGGFSNQIPVVLVRPELILVNLGHIRALIKSGLVVLFDTPDSKDRVQDSPFVKDLQKKLKVGTVETGDQPFEFRALESIFISVVASSHAEMEVLVLSVTKLLARLEDNVDQHKLKELLQYTKKVSRFESRTLLIRDVFEELLSTDEDLAAMYLTEKRLTDSHDEVELLLEAYMKQVEEIANVIALVKHSMQSTEDFVNVILGAKRNQLLLFELRIAMGTLGLSSGMIIAGFYGMNMPNYLEQSPYAFWVVSGVAVTLCGAVFGACSRKLRILAKGTT